ncbi:MAG: 3-hydroxybutyryl-CoA dehydrogenase [Alphaproteobacteria bacterium]|nr:3-hydroxybutyryl-CoA dehydrogenase [Alphaproteobacteria bacterium]
MRFATIGVVGAGVMGAGVAQCLAQTEHSVVLVDVSQEILERARTQIARNLRFGALFNPALRSANHSEVLDRIDLTVNYERLANLDFIIENVTESWEIKRAVHAELDRICRKECILAANTSVILIASLAAATQCPDRVVGMHFMNPVPQMRAVEVIKAKDTSGATVESATEVLQQMGKSAIVVGDKPGFVSNRVLMLAINEAIMVVQDEVAEPAVVDEIFVKCMAHKMGPLATADLIGLDTVLRSLELLCQYYGEHKYRPCSLLKDMVAAGLYGRKSGRGFFRYAGQAR